MFLQLHGVDKIRAYSKLQVSMDRRQDASAAGSYDLAGQPNPGANPMTMTPTQATVECIQYRASSRAVDALVESARFNVQIDEGKTKVYWINGHRINGTKAAVAFMVKEINDWMLECGLVDLDVLKAAHYGNSGHSLFHVNG